MKAREGKLAQDRKQEVSDLRDDGSIFSNEKALVLLSDKEDDENLENESSSDYSIFNGSSLSGCTEVSKLTVIKRIQAIQKIHKIREIFAQQCFIGIVGIQDAGKTTLLKKVTIYNLFIELRFAVGYFYCRIYDIQCCFNRYGVSVEKQDFSLIPTYL